MIKETDISPPSKKVRYIEDMYVNHYTHPDDDQQCRDITNYLDEILNQQNDPLISDNIPHAILQEIGEFSTGNVIGCDVCHHGQIHYLIGDNFNANYVYQNNFNLYEYECDNAQCLHTFHGFHCSDINCDLFVTIAAGNEDLYPNHACNLISCVSLILSNCQKIYCANHWENNGVSCVECSKYFCKDCAKDNGLFCAWNCNTFCCNCCIDQDKVKFYCKMCTSLKSKIYRDGFEYQIQSKK